MDFFLRFAPKVIIKVDAKSILYLRLCKDSAGILLRFSIELSKYEAEIHHVPGIKNEVSDMLSRQHKDIQGILEEQKHTTKMSEKEAETLLKRLTLPEGYKFTAEEVATLLELESLPSPTSKNKKKQESKAKPGKREIKLTPKTLGERKIKVPPTTFRRKGVILPQNKCHITTCQEAQNGTVCNHRTISYRDFANISKFILPGQITLKDFIQTQRTCPIFGPICEQIQNHKGFQILEQVLFRTTPTKMKPVLPIALLDPMIYTKHYTTMGLHLSKTRIRRDIEASFYTDTATLNNKLTEICRNCVQCQFNSTKQDPHTLQKTDFIIAPRATWAVDIIPSMTTTTTGHNAIFLAVDMFTG